MIYTTAKNYYQALAEDHYMVQHNRPVEEGASQLRNSFVDNDNDEGIAANVINNGHFPMVVHASFSGKPVDKNGSMRVKVNSVLWFIAHKNGDTALEAKHIAMEQSFAVMMDFLGRMQWEWEEEGTCGPFKDFDLNLCNWRELEELADGVVGWELMVPHEVAATELLEYDEDKWLTPLND